ncbi:MAG TPA: hypothetical protein VFA36_11630 [Burkholderiales bacterium]|nr:hypothetical protein [Burkholderiales bacterium]
MRDAFRPVLAAVLLAGCISAPVTSLEVSWVAPQLPQAPFKKLLIITVASDEFVQIAFQDQMAAQLKARGVNAVASHRYFTRYTAAEKERFKQSIDESDADFVLLARVTNTAEGVTHSADSVIGTNGVPYAGATGIYGVYAGYGYPGAQGRDYTVKTITAEASIFAEKGDKLIWSARTRTTNAQAVKSGADAATQYIAVILDVMKKDKLLP